MVVDSRQLKRLQMIRRNIHQRQRQHQQKRFDSVPTRQIIVSKRHNKRMIWMVFVIGVISAACIVGQRSFQTDISMISQNLQQEQKSQTLTINPTKVDQHETLIIDNHHPSMTTITTPSSNVVMTEVVTKNKPSNDINHKSGRVNNNKKNKKKKIRLRNGKLPKDLRSPLLLPTPVFIASLPKSATTSAYRFFRCGGHKAAHHWAYPNGFVLSEEEDQQSNEEEEGEEEDNEDETNNEIQIGRCIEQNVDKSQPPFLGCGNYDIWADTGYSAGNGDCFHPELDALDELYQAYPNMTLVLVTRDTDAWYQSLRRHAHGGLVHRWTKHCNATGFPLSFNDENNINNVNNNIIHNNAIRDKSLLHTRKGEDGRFTPNHRSTTNVTANNDEEMEAYFWKSFYEWHTRRIQDFAASHNSTTTFLQVAVEDATVAQQLEQATGIHSICWGQKNKARQKKDPKINN